MLEKDFPYPMGNFEYTQIFVSNPSPAQHCCTILPAMHISVVDYTIKYNFKTKILYYSIISSWLLHAQLMFSLETRHFYKMDQQYLQLFGIFWQSVIILIILSDKSTADATQAESNTPPCNQILFSPYKCTNNSCIRTTDDGVIRNLSNAMNWQRCRQTCGRKRFHFWPAINGDINVSGEYRQIDYNRYGVHVSSIRIDSEKIPLRKTNFFSENLKRFRNQIQAKFLKAEKVKVYSRDVKKKLYLKFEITTDAETRMFYNRTETYILAGAFNATDNNFYVSINASSRFGARHALETLAQIIIFDEMTNQLLVSIYKKKKLIFTIINTILHVIRNLNR